MDGSGHQGQEAGVGCILRTYMGDCCFCRLLGQIQPTHWSYGYTRWIIWGLEYEHIKDSHWEWCCCFDTSNEETPPWAIASIISDVFYLLELFVDQRVLHIYQEQNSAMNWLANFRWINCCRNLWCNIFTHKLEASVSSDRRGYDYMRFLE